MNISVNNNTNLKKMCILSIFTIWDGLSLKTISRYCPFKEESKAYRNIYIKEWKMRRGVLTQSEGEKGKTEDKL